MFLELNSKGLLQSSGKEKESCCLLFPSSTKREIRQFHAVVVHRRQRNVQKKPFARAESFCFACLNLFAFLPFSLSSSSLRKLPISELKQRRFWATHVNRKWFFFIFGQWFCPFLGQLVSIIVKTLRNTNLGASRCFKMKKTSLPVDVRRSKTPLLKVAEHSFAGGQR